MNPARKAFVILLALALFATAFVGLSQNASAAQNAPSWSTGNRWTYSATVLTFPVTMVMLVEGQTSLTIGSVTYPVWNVNVSATASGAGGSITFYSGLWLTVDGLKQAKTSNSFFVSTQSTYDPPQPQYRFPLTPGASWSGTTNVTTTDNTGTHTSQQSYSATVTAEQTVTVPAGTFTTAVIRSPATGSSYELEYYSEQVGNSVKVESYVLGTLTTSQNLTSYSYSPGFLGLPTFVWIVILLVILVVAVAAAFVMRRRPRMPYGMPPGPPMQPPQTPPPQP